MWSYECFSVFLSHSFELNALTFWTTVGIDLEISDVAQQKNLFSN